MQIWAVADNITGGTLSTMLLRIGKLHNRNLDNEEPDELPPNIVSQLSQELISRTSGAGGNSDEGKTSLSWGQDSL